MDEGDNGRYWKSFPKVNGIQVIVEPGYGEAQNSDKDYFTEEIQAS